MTHSDTYARVMREMLNPAYSLLPARMSSTEASVLLLATGMQESRFEHRWQVVDLKRPQVKGPARGFWQFERFGGCKGVIQHPASRYWMHEACWVRGCNFNHTALWHAIEQDDVLAAAAARLLYFTDPRKLPKMGDMEGAWSTYIRVWRPGKPHKHTWPEFYQAAQTFLENYPFPH